MSESSATALPLQRPVRHAYRGLWGVLSSVFKVPQDPPELPCEPGEFYLAIHPDRGFLNYLRLQVIFGLVVAGVLMLIGVGSISFESLLFGAIGLPFAIVLELVSAAVGFLAIHLRYDATWYVLNGRSMRLRHGIWVIAETSITFENIQNVRVTQGPLQRLFGIATIVVETAGGKPSADGKTAGHAGKLEGIANAAEIRDLILTQAASRRRVASHDTGLGDEPETMPVATASGWTREQADLLRDVRDLIRSL